MGFKAWALRQLGGSTDRAATPPFSILGLNDARDVTPRRDLRGLAEEGFAGNPTTYAAIGLLARSIGAVPWLLFQRKGTDLREIPAHALLDLLKRPNPSQSGPDLVTMIEAQRLATGNSFLCAVRARPGEPPRELWPLTPFNVTIERGTPVAGYTYYKGSSNEQTFPPEAVLHQKAITIDGNLWGLSPLAVAAGAIDADNEAMKWNARLLRNDAKPSGALVFDGQLSDAQRQHLRREIREKFSGASNAGKAVILEAGVDWKAFGLSPAELSYIEGIKLAHTIEARVIGVPSELIGDAEHKSYASYTEARASFYQESVLPGMIRLRDNLNAWLAPMFGPDLVLDIDKDQIEGLQEDRSKLWARVESASWLTVNEKRHASGYEPIEGGDVILVSAAVAPLGGSPVPGEGAFSLNLGKGTVVGGREVRPFTKSAGGINLLPAPGFEYPGRSR